MKVILLEKIAHLGSLGDLVTVKDGFGRNYLIPQKKAVSANKSNIAEFEVRRAELEQTAQEALTIAKARAEKIEALASVLLACQASDEGKLYGSIGAKEIAQAMVAADVEVEAREIILPSEEKRGIRQIGEYEATVRLHVDVMTKIKVTIVQENKESA
ncbi:MAG: 50S ribosomal protein L9 [Gammaproteobacteria bacterium]|nr:50S ribosomal protein L9 [Gammaproteobacteria bacterium]MCP4474329.1 50S ribosomal protein L9 [Gammaproteobacteria bacterium]